MGLIPTKSFCSAKETPKGKAARREDAAAGHTSDEGEFPKYKALLQVKIKETNKPQRDITSHLSEQPPSKRQEITSVGEIVEKREPCVLLGM